MSSSGYYFVIIYYYYFFCTDLDVTGSPLKCPFMQAEMDTNASPFTIVFDLFGNSKKGKIDLSYIPIPSTSLG